MLMFFCEMYFESWWNAHAKILHLINYCLSWNFYVAENWKHLLWFLEYYFTIYTAFVPFKQRARNLCVSVCLFMCLFCFVLCFLPFLTSQAMWNDVLSHVRLKIFSIFLYFIWCCEHQHFGWVSVYVSIQSLQHLCRYIVFHHVKCRRAFLFSEQIFI